MGLYHGNKTISCAKLFGDIKKEGKITTTLEFISPFCINFFGDSEEYSVVFKDMAVTLHLDKLYLDKARNDEVRELEKDRWGWTKKSRVNITFPDKIISDNDERTLVTFALMKEKNLTEEEKISRLSELMGESRTDRDAFFTQFWHEKIANPELSEEERKKNMEMLWRNRIEAEREIVLEKGIGVINRFIENLRLIGGLFYLRKIGYNDVFNFKCTYYQGDVKKFEYAVDVSCQSSLLIGQVEKLDLSLIEPLKTSLQSDATIPVFNELLLNARSNFDDENFRMAIIDSISALELFVSEQLYDGMKQMGHDENLIDMLMSKYWHLNERLGKLWKYVFGESVIENNNDLWKKIGGSDKSCLNIRNNILHKGYKPDKVESKEIILTIGETIEKIGQ